MTRSRPEMVEAPRLQAAAAWYVRLAGGALQPFERAAFQAWIEDDGANLQDFEDVAQVWDAVGEQGVAPEILALRRDALLGFEDAHRAQWLKGRRRPTLARSAVGAAACLALAALTGVAWRTLSPQDYRTATGERRVVTLSDGSRLSLDALSEVRVLYGRSARRLWLKSGRAKFEVAKDYGRPFTVEAADEKVRATGTAFSVEIVHGQVQVVLYQGHISISRQKRDDPPQPLRLAASAGVEGRIAGEALRPGHAIVTPLNGSGPQVIVVDPVKSLAWEEGQLVFDGEPLALAIDRVNRYTDHKLSIGDPKVAAVRVDGVFTAGDTDAFVEGVTDVFPVRVKYEADGETLVSR